MIFFQPGEVVSRIAQQRRGAADCGPGPKRRAARHRFGPPLSRALQNAPCDGAKGAELVHTDVRGIRKTNNFHVGLDFFSECFVALRLANPAKLLTKDEASRIAARISSIGVFRVVPDAPRRSGPRHAAVLRIRSTRAAAIPAHGGQALLKR
jgi:hypothetical protein